MKSFVLVPKAPDVLETLEQLVAQGLYASVTEDGVFYALELCEPITEIAVDPTKWRNFVLPLLKTYGEAP